MQDGDKLTFSIELTSHQWHLIRNVLLEDLEIDDVKHVYSPQARKFQQRVINKINQIISNN